MEKWGCRTWTLTAMIDRFSLDSIDSTAWFPWILESNLVVLLWPLLNCLLSFWINCSIVWIPACLSSCQLLILFKILSLTCICILCYMLHAHHIHNHRCVYLWTANAVPCTTPLCTPHVDTHMHYIHTHMKTRICVHSIHTHIQCPCPWNTHMFTTCTPPCIHAPHILLCQWDLMISGTFSCKPGATHTQVCKYLLWYISPLFTIL